MMIFPLDAIGVSEPGLTALRAGLTAGARSQKIQKRL
jgi:hypothetical protein